MNVGLDSNIVIYAGLAPSSPAGTTKEQQARNALFLRASLLLYEHQSDVLFLPAIAVSEILTIVQPDKRGTLSAALATRFTCPIFDLQAAAIAADLWARHKNLSSEQQYANRQHLRADAMIVASAKASGATCFYSHDKNCRTLAALIMTARDMPEKPTGAMRDSLFWAAAFDKGEVPDFFRDAMTEPTEDRPPKKKPRTSNGATTSRGKK